MNHLRLYKSRSWYWILYDSFLGRQFYFDNWYDALRYLWGYHVKDELGCYWRYKDDKGVLHG